MSWRNAIGVLEDMLPQDMQSEEIIWCNRSGWSYDDYRAMKRLGVDPRDHESPIATFEDALFSDEVVEAAIAGYNEVLPFRDQIEEHLRQVWVGERTYEEEADCMRKALQGAISALRQAKEVGNE